ncbi:MAG: hypothetical protein E7672_03255 [Ruminococcaceae bacterium]|nr:hypothetical protein [Oscillospiraceae bacterium]
MHPIMKGVITIKTVIHFPTSASKQKKLDELMSRFHSEYIIEFVEKLNCSTEQKIRLIDAVSKKISDQPLR